MSEHTIDLDCAPGGLRPGDLIMGVVEGTSLEARTTPENTTMRLFGNWQWTWDGISDEEWAAIQEVTKPRIVALYHQGAIRYGSW